MQSARLPIDPDAPEPPDEKQMMEGFYWPGTVPLATIATTNAALTALVTTERNTATTVDMRMDIRNRRQPADGQPSGATETPAQRSAARWGVSRQRSVSPALSASSTSMAASIRLC